MSARDELGHSAIESNRHRVLRCRSNVLAICIPVLVYVIIALLTLVPGRAKTRMRYRPGQSWDYAPQLWAGDQPVVVRQAGVLTPSTRGGARGRRRTASRPGSTGAP